jgi:hypothetical protein
MGYCRSMESQSRQICSLDQTKTALYVGESKAAFVLFGHGQNCVFAVRQVVAETIPL